MGSRTSFQLSKLGSKYKTWFFNKFNEQKGICPNCKSLMFINRGNIIRGKNYDNMATADHIIALKDGGSNGFSNLQIICYKCNKIKDGQNL